MPGMLVSTLTTRSPRRATSSVTRGRPSARADDLERPVGARARTPVRHRPAQRAARRPPSRPGDAAHATSSPSSGISATSLRNAARTASSSRKMSAWSNSTDVSSASAAGSAGTSTPCRRRRCRTRRPRRRSRRPRRGARTGRKFERHAADEERRDRGPRRTSTCASSDDVVVLPCVPAITTERFALEEQLAEQRRERSSGMSRSPRRQHLDVVLAADVADDDQSGPQSRFAAPKPSNTGMPSAASCVDIGG